MAYVPVPNDLSRIKTKLAFNLTKRQLICFSIAGGIGIPFYLFTRSHIGNSTALFLMIGLMMPCFLFAMFEKDGLPFEKVLCNIHHLKVVHCVLPKGLACRLGRCFCFAEVSTGDPHHCMELMISAKVPCSIHPEEAELPLR